MKPARFAAVAAIALMGALAGCTSTTGNDETFMLAYIEGIGVGNANVVVPETAVAGEPFQVEMTTIWNNGCMRKGKLEVSTDPEWVFITPYDILGEVTAGCSGGVTKFVHTSMVTFNSPGTAHVYIQGRSPDNEEVLTLDYEVVVQ
ncbi:MAG TPA: hypothetical protein VKZ41_01100 [Gemmatimonadales bacterium]|nr:hypothetical protein [Gemmatimonadales bacterium]